MPGSTTARMQEQLPRSHGWRNQKVHLLLRQSAIGVARRLKRLFLVIGGLPRAESLQLSMNFILAFYHPFSSVSSHIHQIRLHQHAPKPLFVAENHIHLQ